MSFIIGTEPATTGLTAHINLTIRLLYTLTHEKESISRLYLIFLVLDADQDITMYSVKLQRL